MWDVPAQKELAILKGHIDRVTSVAFSSDGKTLASVGEYQDMTVRLWDVAERKEIVAFEGHTSGIDSVAFSSDGKTLASGGSPVKVLIFTSSSN